MSADGPGTRLPPPPIRSFSSNFDAGNISDSLIASDSSKADAEEPIAIQKPSQHATAAGKEETIKDESKPSNAAETPTEYPEFYKIQCQFADTFRGHGALIEKRMSKTPPVGVAARRRPPSLNPTDSSGVAREAKREPSIPSVNMGDIPPVPASKQESIIEADQPQGSQPLSQSEVLGRPDIYLSDEQKVVLHRVLTSRSSIFFTGAAGTGKSVLSRCIIQELKQRYTEPGQVAVTATTGIAACHIGGLTLHSWAGIGLGKDPVDLIVGRIDRNAGSKGHWTMCKVLIIDEVSMLSFDLLEKLNLIGQRIRGNTLPFGGIQLILTGDMFQLPPVNKDVDAEETRRYCFEANCWDNLINKTFKLTRVFRQTDSKFAEMLNDLRFGIVSEAANKEFTGLCRPAKVPKGIRATKLYPLRRDVDSANESELNRLDGPTFEYHAKDEISANARKAGINMDYGLAPNTIRLKVGAQVMMIKNMNGKLVNGSIGKVLGFVSEAAYIPTKDKKEAGLDVKALGGTAGDGSTRKERRIAFLSKMDPHLDDIKWPWVRFLAPDGTSQTVLVKPEKWETRDTDDELLAARSQIPLILAWAMSIHKSQGQTLPYVSINLEKTFERGQAYVAISRATCLDGLHLARFNRRHVRVDRRVVEFYEHLDGIADDEIERAVHYFEHDYELEVKKSKKEEPEMVKDLAAMADNSSDPDYIPSSIGSSLPHPPPEQQSLKRQTPDEQVLDIEDGSTIFNPQEYLPLSHDLDHLGHHQKLSKTAPNNPDGYEGERDSYIVHSAVQYFPPRRLPPKSGGSEN